jgi:hypothetical protein
MRDVKLASVILIMPVIDALVEVPSVHPVGHLAHVFSPRDLLYVLENLTCIFQVGKSCSYVLIKVSKANVAVPAEKTTHGTCLVVMIHSKLLGLPVIAFGSLVFYKWRRFHLVI